MLLWYIILRILLASFSIRRYFLFLQITIWNICKINSSKIQKVKPLHTCHIAICINVRAPTYLVMKEIFSLFYILPPIEYYYYLIKFKTNQFALIFWSFYQEIIDSTNLLSYRSPHGIEFNVSWTLSNWIWTHVARRLLFCGIQVQSTRLLLAIPPCCSCGPWPYSTKPNKLNNDLSYLSVGLWAPHPNQKIK